MVICNASKTSHSLRVTALFRYEKKSAEQERNVSDLLGPPRDVVDVPDLDLNYEVRDEELCNKPMPSEVFDIDMSKSYDRALQEGGL